MTVTEIKAKTEKQKIKRLAAYCRVSTDKEDQLHSFAAQIRYYMNYADEHKEYKLVDVYADKGLSGKSLKNRDEMNRLLKDCESGKVDCIIVKSVSRFARNTQELLSTLRMLRGIGVTVYFEEQGIDTSKMNSEIFITFPGMIAQQESEAISGNVRWSILEQMKNGEYTPHIPPYGYKAVGGELEIDEAQAIVIRRIFEMYLSGNGKQAIANVLNDEKVPTRAGHTKWTHTTVAYILNNERYMGDAVLQKRYRTEIFPYQSKINHGEKEKYYVEEANLPIVTKETFEATQLLQKKRECHCGVQKNKYILSRMLFCGQCGSPFRKLETAGVAYWICSDVNTYSKDCGHNRVREDKVYGAFSLLTYRLKSNTAIIETVIKQLEKLQGRGDVQNEIYEIDRQIAQLSAQNHVLAKLNKSGVMKAADFAAQSNEIQNKINELRQQRKKKLSASEEDEMLDELQQLLDTVSNCQPTPEFDCDLFDKIVKRIDCIDRETLRFTLLGELKIIEKVRVT